MMSTVEDFENAPIGATASLNGSVLVWKETETVGYPWWHLVKCVWLSNGELAERGFTLTPTAPTTAREALDLAWDLAHPVKEGQVIPKGTKWMKKTEGDVQGYTMRRYYTVTADNEYTMRTHEPLPDPEPDWLNAPAVLAVAEGFSHLRIWAPLGDGDWANVQDGSAHWSELRDVTPLYPKENS